MKETHISTTSFWFNKMTEFYINRCYAIENIHNSISKKIYCVPLTILSYFISALLQGVRPYVLGNLRGDS